jgi:hypothetical protein
LTASANENPGCLGAILRLFGIGSREAPSLPYRMRDDFLSSAEISFYRALCAAAGDAAVVCPKVNLADLFFVVRPNENQAYRNKIDRKHVDFLLCDPTSMRPLVGVELDDASHKRADRQAHDEFVDDVFKVAELPLVRVPARSGYSVGKLSALLGPRLGQQSAAAMPVPQPVQSGEPIGATPVCRKCGVSMVLRTAARGGRQGEQFWGCPNYPKCRETVPLAGKSATA